MSVEVMHQPMAPHRARGPHLVVPLPTAAVPQAETDVSAIQAAVEEAVLAMRADLFCDAGIAGIAAGTFYSKFHFTREFSRLVGTTPRRFLASLRMERASNFLLNTDLSIADAGTMVGYSSVGTFSTRFSALVGMSPRRWRACQGKADPIGQIEGTGQGQLRGQVALAAVADAATCDIFVGAFEDSIVQGPPVAATRLNSPGSFTLHGLNPGTWTVSVLARVAHPVHGREDHVEWLRAAAPMTVFADHSTSQLPTRFTPRPVRPTDPPVLLGGVHAEPAPTKPLRKREYPLDMIIEQR